MSSLGLPAGPAMDEHDLAAYLKATAEALAETTRMQREIAQAMQHHLAHSRRAATGLPSHRGPSNPLHRTWRGFVEDLQHLEALAHREGLKVSKANVAQFGVDTVKTITRTMEWYGLSAHDWPPSTWDANEPRTGGKTRE